MILLFFFLAYWLGLSIKKSIVVLIILLIIFLLFVLKRLGKRCCLLCLLISAVGFGISNIDFHINKNSYSGFVIESKENYLLFQSGFEKYYIYQKNNDYEIGDFLNVSGRCSNLNFITIESDFDFAKFLNNKGIKYEILVDEINISFKNPIRLKQYRKYIFSNLNKDASSLISVIVLGGYEENEVINNIRDWHLTKLLSSSGVFLSLFISILCYILSLKFKEKICSIVIFIFLLLYTILTFPRFSVLKFLILYVAKNVNKYFFKNKFSYITVLSFVGILFLLLNKYFAYQDSFILGFLIPIIYYYSNTLFTNKNKYVLKLKQSILIFLFFIPFELRYYNSISLLSIPLQVILTPIFLFLSIFAIITLLGIPIFFIDNFICSIIKKILIPLNKNALLINLPSFNEFQTLIYYFLLAIIIYYIAIKFKPISKLCLSISLGLFVMYIIPIKNYISNQVSFINVGQGDACLIRKQDATILIDTGGSLYKDIANNSIIPFLRKQRIYNIDLLITTHDDFDHSGAKEDLIDNFKVKSYVSLASSFPLTINGLTLYNYNTFSLSSSDDNEKSLVIGFSLMNLHFLITGDAPIKIEKQIMSAYSKIPCDVLKVGHHGSDTSTCPQFLDFLSPKEAIISVGKNNYGHPSNKVIGYLKQRNIKIHRTDEENTITYFNYIFNG